MVDDMAVGGTIPDCQLAGVVFGLTDVLGQLLIQRFGDSQYGPQMGQMGHPPRNRPPLENGHQRGERGKTP